MCRPAHNLRLPKCKAGLFGSSRLSRAEPCIARPHRAMSLTSEERIVAVSMPADPTFGITKYERARAIGTRARQISMNSPAHVDATGMVDELEIATLSTTRANRRRLCAGTIQITHRPCPIFTRYFADEEKVEHVITDNVDNAHKT